MSERVPDEALAGLREMALFTAVKGKLLLQLLDEIEDGRKAALAQEMIRKLRRKFINLPKGTRFRSVQPDQVPGRAGMMSPQMRSLLVLALLRVVMEDAKHIRHRHRCECGHSWEHTGQEAASTPNAHTCICGRRVTKPEFDFQQQQQRGEEDGRRT